MSRLSRVAFGGVVVLLGCLLSVATTFAWLRGDTPSIRDRADRGPPRALAELDWVTLGGARQAVLLRGADTTRPVVLFLHGGLGSAHFPFLEEPERFRLALRRVDSVVSRYWIKGPAR